MNAATTAAAKPRIRTTSDGRMRITFPDGRTAKLWETEERGYWAGWVSCGNHREYIVRPSFGQEHAFRQAACLGVEPPASVQGVTGDQLAYVAESGIDDAIKTIRTMLRRRTGRAWSVKRGRGTAYNWLTIDAPPARKVDGYMTAEDQGLLYSIFGECHHQGISIRTERGVRAHYACKAAGVPLPESVQVDGPSWD